MLAFLTRHGARFTCEADFTRGPVVNVNFFDANREGIPFHLSLRRDERLFVVNRRGPQGWRREIQFPADPGHRPIQIDATFSPWHVRLFIDGQDYGRFDAFPRPDRAGRFYLRHGFLGLSQIAEVEIDGPLVPGSLLLSSRGARPAVAAPVLNDALELTLRMTPQMPDHGVVLRAQGTLGAIPAVLRRLPYADDAGTRAQEWAAVLPGRLWDASPEALTLSLTEASGPALGQLTITRKQMAAHVGALAEAQTLAQDDRAALQAVEHARHARLMSDLTDRQRRSLLTAANRFRLGPYLTEGQHMPLSPAPAAPVNTGAAQRQSLLRNRFTQHMRDNPGARPQEVLNRIWTEDSTPKPLRATLLTALTEWFCLNDDPRSIAQMWLDQRLPQLTPASHGDRWTLSAQLPLLYCAGRFDDVVKGLWALAPARNDWILTPCVGWIARQLAVSAPSVDQRLPALAQRRAMFDAVSGFLESRATEYWDRTECTSVIDGMVAILGESTTLPRDQHDALIWMLLRIYGLSPAFWTAVQNAQRSSWTLPLRMQRAQAAFADLSDLIAQGPTRDGAAAARIDHLLNLFRQWGCVDAARFRRDLLGPAGVSVPGGYAPDPDDILLAGLNPEESALRFLAFPRDSAFKAPVPAALTEAARRGLIGAYSEVPAGSFRTLQVEARVDAQSLLGGADKATLQRLLRHLTPMAGPEGEFLGIGLALSLVCALIGQKRTAEAALLAGQIEAMRATITDDWALGALRRAPAPMLALRRLCALYPGNGLTRRLVSALGPPPALGPPDGDAVDQHTQVNPLLNTVVCLYSCVAHLDTRVAAIRQGWMQELEAQGVPCLVFVGNGDGQRTGDVVALAAPDDYEGLPQKTLAMVRWVRDHTDFDYMLKVDDDCFLDSGAFFADLSWQKFDYYGRPLTRGRGQMDRAWHMGKSASPRGRLELDKSPEPSTYADGGSGYSLSRQAMQAVCAASETPDGQDLISVSFMEDKLVGDLLALSNIWPRGEDYRISVLRRTMPGGPLVPAWENGFPPFAGSGIKLAHLDGHDRQAQALSGSHDPWPRSFKIWPSPQPVRLGWRSNTLDLISDPGKLAEVNAAEVAVIACLRNEIFMLPHFLQHYRAQGVTGFLIADNGSDDGSFEYLADQPDVALFAVDTDYSASHYGVSWQQALMANFRVGRWSLVADADELAVIGPNADDSLPTVTARIDAEGANAARVFMLDMYPSGPLSDADFTTAPPFEQAGFVDAQPFLRVSGARGPYSNSPTWTSALRHRLMPGSRAELFVAQKYALLKYQPWMRLSAGLHFVANAQVARQELFFAHFKYNAAFHAKAQAEVARQQHFNNAEEYQKYLRLAAEGRNVLFDPDVSVHWAACDFVRSRLDPQK